MKRTTFADLTTGNDLRRLLVRLMASLLFKAQLVDAAGKPRTQVARILFGVDSPDEKEKTFRLICKSKYPQLRIQEPLSVSPAPIE